MPNPDNARPEVKALPLFAHLGKETFAQAMFDIAWNGLKSQDWQLGLNAEGSCGYLTPQGRRCAWGLCDTTLDTYDAGSVEYLRKKGRGLAAYLDFDEIQYAIMLQGVHDGTVMDDRVKAGEDHRRVLRERLREWAVMFELTVPSEES